VATITIMDPVTRIEGHMKVEVTIDQVNARTQVVDARCTGTLFRGFEKILQGRDPKDAPVITQRICGVCPVSHSLAASMAVEGAAGRKPSNNARVLRNLVLGANYLQSHILHFYLLAALDYVKGPNMAPWTPAWDVDMRAESDLNGVAAHLGEALEARRRAHEMGAVFGGRMPCPHTIIPGGFTASVTAQKVADFRGQLTWLRGFIRNVYVPDVETVGQIYADYLGIGRGSGNLLSFGVFDLDGSGTNKLLKRGIVRGAGVNGASALATTVSTANIKEFVSRSWYANSTTGLAPASGLTQPQYPKTDAYSWLKAPRYSGKPMEAGPLARMWVTSDYREGVSVMDRHLARAHEALKLADAMDGWLNQLITGGGDYAGFPGPTNATGVGLTEAPRGALGHWVQVARGRISRYQVVTPTCWNASPRDDQKVPGPMEQALIGTPIQDPSRPIEALRVIHSFDPCLSCAVHVMRPDRPVVVVQAGMG
jgi:hydrogenase large subunit